MVESNYPTISIVTPSYNQAAFLEKTIQSVINPNYPKLEYIIIDGGSTDGSVDIINRYASHLAYWISEQDNGQYDAINKGFAKSTGEIMAWLNSDDVYMPWTLSVIGEIFYLFPEVEWITSLLPINLNSKGVPIACSPEVGFSRKRFNRAANCKAVAHYATSYIYQESTFWRRSLWEKAGSYVDDSLRMAADFELWARFYQHSDLYGVKAILGGFRLHSNQKTALHNEQSIAEVRITLQRHGIRPYNKFEALMRHIAAGIPRQMRRGIMRHILRILGLTVPSTIIQYNGINWIKKTVQII